MTRNKAIRLLFWHHDAERWYEWHDKRGWFALFPRAKP